MIFDSSTQHWSPSIDELQAYGVAAQDYDSDQNRNLHKRRVRFPRSSLRQLAAKLREHDKQHSCKKLTYINHATICLLLRAQPLSITT